MARSVTITFELSEDVTPDIFTSKVALAVAKGCLRPGEKLRRRGSDYELTITGASDLSTYDVSRRPL